MNRPADPNANAATHSTQVSPVSRIAKVFAKLQGERRKALIPYVTAGFPTRTSLPSSCTGWSLQAPT